MEFQQKYDLVIIGAGPAGATVARHVAQHGHDVLIIEKDRLPRYKACAGGVTVRAARLLDFDVSPVVERTVDSGRFSYRMRRFTDKTALSPISYMVMRDRFDRFLVEKAQEAGAGLLDGARVRSVAANGDGAEVNLGEAVVQAKVLVGADGANSVVARAMGLNAGAEADLALEAEVAVPENILRPWERRVAIDVGVVRGGYAWVFPKAGNLSIGVAGLKRYAPQLRRYFDDFMAWLNLGPHEVLRFKGHHIPLRNPRSALAQGPALVVGDAAGLADPFSGEGIYHAIRSAKLAGPVIVEALGRERVDLSSYQAIVKTEMEPDVRIAAAWLKLFKLSPALAFFILRFHRPWNSACRLLLGENDWVQISRRVGPLRPLIHMLRG